MMKSYWIVISLLFFNSNIFSQSDESIVAQIGNENITAKEFKFRFELSPYVPKNHNISRDSVKYDFLYSLIAEKLWALKAKEQGIDVSQKFNFFFRPIEDLFVRDALFKQEIENKVKISKNDMEKGINKSQITQVTRFLSSKDSISIFNFHKLLLTNNNVDSLIISFTSISDTVADIKFGVLNNEIIEDSIYSLNKGNFSFPIKIESAWIILICKDQLYTPIDLGDNKITSDIEKIINGRKLKLLYDNYRNNLLSGTEIKINPEPFGILAQRIWEKINVKSFTAENEKTYFELNEQDFNNLLSELTPDILSATLFNVQENKVSLYSFLSKLAYSGFSITRLDSNLLKLKLALTSKRFVEEQILTFEGYKKGYHLLPQVQNDLNAWKQKYLAQMYMVSTLDSVKVTEPMLWDYYQNDFLKVNSTDYIKLQLITLNDLDEVSKLLDKMNAGNNFGELASYYGKTDSLVNINGESDLVPIIFFEDLTDIVSAMNVNEIYGPVKRSNGYSILKLIEKVEKSDSISLAFEDIKNQLHSNLRVKILNDKLNKITANLSVQKDVKIFSQALNKMALTNIPMFVHRFMGFGGRIAGMPLLTPFSGWINEQVKQKLLP